MSKALSEKQRIYQATLEATRTALEHNMDDDELIQALEHAEAERDIAWLTACTGPSAEPSRPSRQHATRSSTNS